MTTAYTNIRVETIKSEGKAFDFWVVANRGGDRVILARVGWQAGSFCHVTTETEAKCWADLFADALRLKRENDKLKQELTEQGWQPIETAPRCVAGGNRDNGRRPVLVTYYPHVGNHPPVAVARLTVLGWISGKRGNALWFQPTHWMPLPAPPNLVQEDKALPAVSLGGAAGRQSGAEVGS
jgi:hypothetical protein